jgi:hypothetical protein
VSALEEKAMLLLAAIREGGAQPVCRTASASRRDDAAVHQQLESGDV